MPKRVDANQAEIVADLRKAGAGQAVAAGESIMPKQITEDEARAYINEKVRDPELLAFLHRLLDIQYSIDSIEEFEDIEQFEQPVRLIFYEDDIYGA